MPDIIKAYGYHIYFWSNENEPLEYVHFHISKTPHQSATKYWLLRDGTLKQANNNDDISANDLKRIINLMSKSEYINKLKEKWLEHFGEISYIQ